MLVLGTCDSKGNYIVTFEFLLPDLLQLYSCLLNCMKIFSECHETPNNGIILTRETEVYRWHKSTLIRQNLTVSFSLERNKTPIFELKFNYDQFNKFVQALYFLTWQAMSLKERELEILMKLIPLPFGELFEFKDTTKLLIFLKKITVKPNLYSFIIQYHIETIFFLHKINRIINNENIQERLNVLCST